MIRIVLVLAMENARRLVSLREGSVYGEIRQQIVCCYNDLTSYGRYFSVARRPTSNRGYGKDGGLKGQGRSRPSLCRQHDLSIVLIKESHMFLWYMM